MKCRKLPNCILKIILLLFFVYIALGIYYTYIVKKPDAKILNNDISLIIVNGQTSINCLYTVEANSNLHGRLLITLESTETNTVNLLEELNIDVHTGIVTINKAIHIPNTIKGNVCYNAVYHWQPLFSWVIKSYNLEPVCFTIPEVSDDKK